MILIWEVLEILARLEKLYKWFKEGYERGRKVINFGEV